MGETVSMPIVYVHGVATRGQPLSPTLEALLRRYIAPLLAPDVNQVAIFAPYWGDLGATFAWNRMSCPSSTLFPMGAALDCGGAAQALALGEFAPVLADLPQELVPDQSDLAPSGPTMGTGWTFRLSALSDDQLADLLTTLSFQAITVPEDQAQLVLAADAIAHDPEIRSRLAACTSAAEEVALVQELLTKAVQQQSDALAPQGVTTWTNLLGDRLGEIVSRTETLPGMVATRVAGEFRKPINSLVTLFFGDVFAYLANRTGADGGPGPIPCRILDALHAAHADPRTRDGEPVVVLSHSMGGQIVYDLVSYFLPRDPALAGLRIDFWAAAASQVGLFEELKLFLLHNPAYAKALNTQVPFPNRKFLGGWWNVWDPNDFISYTVADIIDDVDDECYSTGTSGLHAHSSYLDHPSFFRRFAAKLVNARDHTWWHP